MSKWQQKQHGRRIKTAYSVLCARKKQRIYWFTQIEYKMEMGKRQNKPRSTNWEWSHSIKEDFK